MFAFPDPFLEQRWWELRVSKVLRTVDVYFNAIYLLCAYISLAKRVWLAADAPFHVWVIGISTLVFSSVPLLLMRSSNYNYLRLRPYWILPARLLRSAFALVSTSYYRGRGRAHIDSRNYMFSSTLVRSGALLHFGLSLGMQLPMHQHLLVQLLCIVPYLLGAKGFCSTEFNSESSRTFISTAWQFIFAVNTAFVANAPEVDYMSACTSFLNFTQAVFGLVVPCFILYKLDWASRQGFLASNTWGGY